MVYQSVSFQGVKAEPLAEYEKEFFLKFKEKKSSRLLVAVSGGRDSIALLHVLARLRSRLGWQIVVAHVHHGPVLSFSRQGQSSASVPSSWAHPTSGQLAFRQRAFVFVEKQARELGLEFVSHPELMSALAQPGDPNELCAAHLKQFKEPLESEEDLRRYRYLCLEMWRAQSACDWIVLAHHARDQFETRVLQMLRGCGVEGLRGMSQIEGRLWRPFLETSFEQICLWVEQNNWAYLDDPSNQQSLPLRNWLRQEWLPSLEQKRPGALQSWARSFDTWSNVLSAAEANLPTEVFVQKKLDRKILQFFTFEQTCLALAIYVRRMNLQGITRGQIEEITKRLDNSQNEIRFKVARLTWATDADFFWCQSVTD